MSQIGMFGVPPSNSQTSYSLVVSLAQLVSPSVALPAELVSKLYLIYKAKVSLETSFTDIKTKNLHRYQSMVSSTSLTIYLSNLGGRGPKTHISGNPSILFIRCLKAAEMGLTLYIYGVF